MFATRSAYLTVRLVRIFHLYIEAINLSRGIHTPSCWCNWLACEAHDYSEVYSTPRSSLVTCQRDNLSNSELSTHKIAGVHHPKYPQLCFQHVYNIVQVQTILIKASVRKWDNFTYSNTHRHLENISFDTNISPFMHHSSLYKTYCPEFIFFLKYIIKLNL